MNAQHPGGLTREHVVWAYRLFLDREPENEDVIGPKLAGSRDTAELRHHLMTSAEFQQKNRDYAHTNDRTIVIKELDGGVRLLVDLSDHVIGLNIVRGRYEEDGVAFVRRVLAPGDNAVDAGAHIGFFTMHMAAMVGPAGKVHAFEPYDSNADLLERSIAENRFGDRVVFRRAAVGPIGNGHADLSVETLNTGGAYLLRNGTTPLPATRSGRSRSWRSMIRARAARAADQDGRRRRRAAGRAGARRLLAQDRPMILRAASRAARSPRGTSVDAFLADMRALDYVPHARARRHRPPTVARACRLARLDRVRPTVRLVIESL